VYASVARLAVLKFVNYMNASADVLALASVEVPINGIPEGGCVVIKYVAYTHTRTHTLSHTHTHTRLSTASLRAAALYCTLNPLSLTQTVYMYRYKIYS
jgi:ubiquinol-cytochrome c reductase iron-sulfur subunit